MSRPPIRGAMPHAFPVPASRRRLAWPAALAAAGLCAAVGAAQADTVLVQIEDLGLGNGQAIEENSPGFGSSGAVTLNWNPFDEPTQALLNWTSSYSGRAAAFCGNSLASNCALDMTVADGFSLTLDSFWFGSWFNLDRTLDWSVTDLDGMTVVASATDVAVPGSTGLTVSPGLTSSVGFRIQFGSDGFYNGINDITYSSSVTAVPEPASWALALAGLGVVGHLVRRRRPG